MGINGAYPEVLEDIQLFTLENENGTKLVVSNYGAAVVSLFVRDRDGVVSDIVLGYQDHAGYAGDQFYLGTVVGRYANRISGDTVMIDDLPYKISVTDGGYHLHGGNEGFNKKVFRADVSGHPLSNKISLKYRSPHMEEGFPGELSLEVIYTLDNDDAWTIEYRASSDRTTLVNLTQHTYFNLSGNTANGIQAHELQINGTHYLPVNSFQVPTGKLASVSGTPFDFTKLKRIGEDLSSDDEQILISGGYDHSFVLEQHATPLLKDAAIVKDPVSGRVMELFTTEPAVHLYTGNFLADIKGKYGAVYQKRSGFCLETQHFPDAPRHAHFPSTILKPGKQLYSKTIFRFSTE